MPTVRGGGTVGIAVDAEVAYFDKHIVGVILFKHDIGIFEPTDGPVRGAFAGNDESEYTGPSGDSIVHLCLSGEGKAGSTAGNDSIVANELSRRLLLIVTNHVTATLRTEEEFSIVEVVIDVNIGIMTVDRAEIIP